MHLALYGRNRSIFTLLISFVFVTGCSSAPADNPSGEEPSRNSASSSEVAQANTPQAESHPNDPFESFNRAMWTLNYDYLDPYLVRPVSLAYVNYTPDPLRLGVRNFLANLDEPFSMVNNAVMGNGGVALDHFNRFWLNSTLGLLGFIDIATYAGIEKRSKKEFGDALGHYGTGKGAYIMLPAYGPIVVREGADFVDGLYPPISYLSFWASFGKWALEGMEKRALVVPQEVTLENSPDPYALTREVYLQRQDYNAEVASEEIDADEEAYLDEYLEEGFD
ncbi:MlaA family lipoprotein [Vibrio sp. ZSDZ34]|uniref:MlaA family lipoprotein n=1 Tax=Vibrio gelatinilyticus TaxID=2893468 RepID=A0A9X2AZ04_9VIBR|nr:MlaA family lipoprotein [Vibrio gelatinilyticus]MCJ2377307.1 MlaA family lipoprotein [Vibrio gelatinilyticus]